MMDSQQFRRNAHHFVDWMADYLDRIRERPVRAPVAPGAVASRLAVDPPARGESMEDLFEDFQETILPGMTHWQHPRFFAYFPANSSRPSVLAEMLTATLAAQCMSWETSPAATELEERVVDWLRGMVGLPDGFVGSIQDTAGTATLCAIVAARERATGFAANRSGMRDREQLTVYCSAEAHSSVEKDVKVAGIGSENLRLIAVDDDFAMLPAELERAMAEDKAAGNRPACVVATVGTTGSSGIDPLRAIGDVCRRYGVWLHVDAAWAGSALVLPDYRWMIDGIESVDSIVFNPHKWLLTNFDCSVLFVRNVEEYLKTFVILPEYLKTRQGDSVTNYRDWGLQLGRRFRALKLWFVIRCYGVEGLKEKIRSHIGMAHDLAKVIEATDDFELLRSPVLSLLCFRYRPTGVEGDRLDALNETLLGRINDGGFLYLTHTRLREVYAIRFVIGQTETTSQDVIDAWSHVERVARAM